VSYASRADPPVDHPRATTTGHAVAQPSDRSRLLGGSPLSGESASTGPPTRSAGTRDLRGHDWSPCRWGFGPSVDDAGPFGAAAQGASLPASNGHVTPRRPSGTIRPHSVFSAGGTTRGNHGQKGADRKARFTASNSGCIGQDLIKNSRCRRHVAKSARAKRRRTLRRHRISTSASRVRQLRSRHRRHIRKTPADRTRWSGRQKLRTAPVRARHARPPPGGRPCR
jgi:hypothetical protein